MRGKPCAHVVPRCRASAPITAAAVLLIAFGAQAGSPNIEEYCISGAGNGTGWDWEVRDDGLLTVQHADTNLSVVGTAADVRDAFVSSINAQGVTAPYLTARAVTPLPSACATADAAFSISGQNPFDLWVLALATGSLTLVGPSPTGTVTFNPDIYLPAPSAGSMLAAGLATLALLNRGRARH